MKSVKNIITGGTVFLAVFVSLGCSDASQSERTSASTNEIKVFEDSVIVSDQTTLPAEDIQDLIENEIIWFGADPTDDECCTEPGQARECWGQDAEDDLAIITCSDGADCASGECVSERCTCTTDTDCDGNGACSENGVCGPSWCNGYLICSCWGGCDWWHTNTSLTPNYWANTLSKYCCEGNYPEGGNDPDAMVSGYLSNDPSCGSGCSDDDDCDYLEDECRDGVCDVATGICNINFWPAGTECNTVDDYSAVECRNQDVCDDSGNCIPNFVPQGTACSDIDPIFNLLDPLDAPYYPPTCYTGFCGEVTPDTSSNPVTNDFGPDDNGRCEPGIELAENDTCELLFDVDGSTLKTLNTGYLGSFLATTHDNLALNIASGSTTCSENNYQALADGCYEESLNPPTLPTQMGATGRDLVYSFEYETNEFDDYQLYAYVITLEAEDGFDAAMYVSTSIDDVGDCPANDVPANRCLMPYQDSPTPPVWEDHSNHLGNAVEDQLCVDPAVTGYKWCSRGTWDYPDAPVPCDDGSTGTTTCSNTTYNKANMSSTVVYPVGRSNDEAGPVTKKVFIFVDAIGDSYGNFTLKVEKQKWNAGPLERINDDPRVYDLTGSQIDPAGSVFLGNFRQAVNSMHSASGLCGGYDCSAGWTGKSTCHDALGTANESWPNKEFFKISEQLTAPGAVDYCITVDEIHTNDDGSSIHSPDIVLERVAGITSARTATLSPLFVGTVGDSSVTYDDTTFDCVHDNSESYNENYLLSAAPNVNNLISLSQYSPLSAPCTGDDCNYRMVITPGPCPAASDDSDCSEPSIGKMSDLTTCDISEHDGIDYEIHGEIEICSGGSPGWIMKHSTITSECPGQNAGAFTRGMDGFTPSFLQGSGPDFHWLLTKAPAATCTEFTILMIENYTGNAFHQVPFFDIDACNFRHTGMSVGGNLFINHGGSFDDYYNPPQRPEPNLNYKAHLAEMGIPDTYNDEPLGWARIEESFMHGWDPFPFLYWDASTITWRKADIAAAWPFHLAVEVYNGPVVDEDAHFDIYISWR